MSCVIYSTCSHDVKIGLNKYTITFKSLGSVKRSEVTLETFMLLQKNTVSNKCCSL